MQSLDQLGEKLGAQASICDSFLVLEHPRWELMVFCFSAWYSRQKTKQSTAG
jgi:hypothetical protein